MSGFGQVPRDQRQQELEYFLNKQYNSIGLRLQTKLVSIEKQFQNTNNIAASNNEVTNTIGTQNIQPSTNTGEIDNVN